MASRSERPATVEAAAAVIRDSSAAGMTIEPRGGGTKLGWRPRVERTARPDVVDLDTRGLDRIVEHNQGDFTAVVEAGITLAAAQVAFAACGQMLALDPPLGAGDAATLGGIIATNDSGPLRHRYGGARDLLLGATVILSDGTVATSGGKVIKNVAGYDLAKLFAGSFGTLGLIARVAVRLHPLPTTTATAIGETRDPERLAGAVAALARIPLEADCLDVTWSGGSGRLLIRFAGDAAEERATAAMGLMTTLDVLKTVRDDPAQWARQRRSQRADSARGGTIVKVSGRPTDLPLVLRTADAAGGSVISRAGLGVSWVALPEDADIGAVRRALAPRACTVLDGADRITDPWPEVAPGALAVMQRIKARFDPARSFRPGAFVGGI